MAGEDFLAKIKLALDGKEKVVQGLAETQRAAQQLAKTKVTTVFDKEGVATGKQIEDTFTKIKPAATGAANKMGDFERALRRVIVVAPVWMVFRGIIQSTLKVIKEQIDFLINLETAMARIRIVGKGTEEQYQHLQATLIGLSVAYGTVASAAVDAALIFAQQGRSVEEIITLTRTAMMGSQILGADMKTTVDNLTAAVESFNIPIENSISIIDKWINVEKQFAVTSKDLADATKVAGATANQLGVTINSFLGDVTAVIEVTRKSGSEAARGLSFIYARLLTTGQKALEQFARIPIYLNEQGEATFRQTNTLRDATDVLDDLASKWDLLTNKERLEIAQTVASKRQLTTFMALMQNYNASINARIAALSSAGKAEQAFGIIQETVKIKLDRLSASWNFLTSAIADTSSFKSALDVLSDFIQGLAIAINLEKGYKAEAEKVKDSNKKANEILVSQAQNLIELIELRDKYFKAPPTENNIKMLEKIQQALIDTKYRASSIDVDLNVDDAIKRLESFIDITRKIQIQQEVDIDFNVDKNILEQKLKKLKTISISPVSAIVKLMNLKSFASEIIGIENQLKALEETRNKILVERTTAYDTEKTKKEAIKMIEEDEVEMQTELTDAEMEKLDIQEKLDIVKKSGLMTNQQLLNLEIELVKNSLYSYDIHDKKLKLLDLEKQRNSAILSDYEKQTDLLSQILKFSGEQESTIIRQEMAMKVMMYGETYLKNSMDDRLKLAQALTKEVDAQEKSSSRLVELYKLAKKYGKETAQEVSEFLGGGKKFEELSPGATRAIKKALPAEYEEAKAKQYFGKIPEFKFPEEIQTQREIQRNIEILNNVMIEPIQLHIDIDSEDIIRKIKYYLLKAIENEESDIAKALKEKIENF